MLEDVKETYPKREFISRGFLRRDNCPETNS
jgi:hypothetical protein